MLHGLPLSFASMTSLKHSQQPTMGIIIPILASKETKAQRSQSFTLLERRLEQLFFFWIFIQGLFWKKVFNIYESLRAHNKCYLKSKVYANMKRKIHKDDHCKMHAFEYTIPQLRMPLFPLYPDKFLVVHQNSTVAFPF